MKTIKQALMDEIIYPLPEGKIDNICIMRNIDGDLDFEYEISQTDEFKGALADCLFALVQAVNFSEADKSVSAPNESDKKRLFAWMNRLYASIGEAEVDDGTHPRIIAKDFLL